MDPNAAMIALMDHIEEGEIDEAIEVAASLSEWLARGGFAPTAPCHPGLVLWLCEQAPPTVDVSTLTRWLQPLGQVRHHEEASK